MANLLPRLPQELLNMIIDDDPEDGETQKAFALVSKKFNAQSRKHFFHSIDFLVVDDDDKSRRRHAAFHRILQENTLIATFVREVRVRDIAEAFDPPENERPSWIRDEPSFHHTLRIFAGNGISRFTLETDLYWSSFPLELKRALMEVFLAPTLVYLGLAGLQSLPKSCCPAFRSVQELFLDDVVLDEDDDEDLPTPLVGEAVTSWLGFQNVTGDSLKILLDALIPASSDQAFQHLQVLHIGPHGGSDDDNDVPVIQAIVIAARKSLTHFSWTYTHTGNTPPSLETSPIDLAVVHKLSWVCFEVTSSIPSIPDHFVGLLSLLGTIEPAGEVQTIHIILHYSDHPTALSSVAQYDGWDRLGVILARLETLSDLRIYLYVLAFPTTAADTTAAAAAAEEHNEGQREELERHVATRLAGYVDVEEILEVSVMEQSD